MGNTNLRTAHRVKNDEFYTRLEDIEKELYYYRDYFKDKVVYCNCDDPRESNFFHYFSYKFEELGLKRLIASCYKNTIPWERSRGNDDDACYLIYDGPKSGQRIPQKEDIEVKYFKGDGDFRSKESIELLKQSDIVVTNPPFSLFREFIGQLMEYQKKFLVIGHGIASIYREIFPYIKNEQMWLGIHHVNRFDTPNGEKGVFGIWYTNLENKRRNEEIYLYENYNPEKFPKYDYFDAINVDKVKMIPKDYYGMMGVPITFLEYHEPKQFKIITAITRHNVEDGATPETRGQYQTSVNGKHKFGRIIIQRVDQPEGLDPEYPVFPNPKANPKTNYSKPEFLSN